MKAPKAMKLNINGKFSRYGLARAGSKNLISLILSFLALPCWLSAQTLLHRYSFVSDASDSVGSANGTLVAPNGGSSASINNGLTLPGGGGPGYSGYVSLPAGILTNTRSLTVECWATQSTQNGWAELWNFNNGTGQYIGFIPYPANNNNNMSMAIKNNNESDALSGDQFPVGSEQYVAVTFDTNTLVGSLYTNGSLIASVKVPDNTYIPGTFGGASGTLNNYLGQDPWPDPQFQGTIYEFRIWDGVVSQRYLSASALAGPSVVINNLTPTSVSVTAEPSVIITGTEQANVTVQLPQTGTANLPATSDATNWTSSNPNVLAVNSSGVISGVGVGSATVSATVAGVTATSDNITVTGPQTLLHRYSFVGDASDSVGGADGTLVAGTAGAAATINNGLILPGNQTGGFGYSGYVSLPSGILTNTTSLTIECWVTQNQGNGWAELWDFGNNGSQNFGLIPYPQNNGTHMEVAFTPNGGEQDLQSAVEFPNGSEQYVCLTYNNFTLKGNLYNNGALVATTTFPNTSYVPGGIGGAGGTAENMLGNDVFGDWQFSGIVYEFRIWNGALSPVYAAVSAAAGPSVVVTNLTPSALTVTVTNTSMIGAQTQPATVVGDFKDASGVTVTDGATNWTSSDASVLTVNSSGLITAQSGGNATVSATVNGVTATSAAITVANTSPTLPQKPADQTVVVGQSATFTVEALGGGLSYQWSFGATAITDATNASLTLSNVGFTNAGTYSVLVSNNLGSTNATAVLSVVQKVLEHRYSFVSDASDSVGGSQWNGTLVAPNGGAAATINNGLSLPGNQNGGFGYSGYVSFPSGILTNTSSLTVECWATQDSQNTWAELWDFGNSGSQNFGLIPYPANNNNNMEVAFTPHGNEIDLQSAVSFPNSLEQYVALTFNATTLVGNLYTNGALVATHTFPDNTYIPGTIGGASGTSENMLGNDVYGDWQFGGTVYEFRIWDGAATPLYLAISAAAGPSVVVTNLTPQSLTVTVTDSSMVAGQTQQATVVGDFQDASGITVTTSATNWTSSDPSVLTVDSSGVITAVNTGSATVSATVNGVTGTSDSITVPSSVPIITQQPQAAETLLAGATLNASVATIGNLPIVYRWYFNGDASPISTSTNDPSLTIPNIQLGAAGSYTCLASNQYGTAPISSPLSLTVVSPTVYQQALLSLNPIAYWPLNETGGTTAYDVIGGYNGTYNGSYLLGQPGPTNSFFGASSYSAGFDGVSAYVDIPEGPFNITGAITVVAWVDQLALNNFDGLFGHGDTSWRMSINGSGDPGAADGNTDADATGPATIDDGNWHMVAYTYTGVPGQVNNGSLYVDGVLVAHNTVSVTPAGNNLDVWIGGAPDYGTTRLLPADIAGAAIFDQALTAAQVQGLYSGVFVEGPEIISITHSGSNVVLTWQSGVLLQSPSLLGPWTTNSSAVSPYTVPAISGNQFFKLLVSP
jgi:uncharacterized protein YjdB